MSVTAKFKLSSKTEYASLQKDACHLQMTFDAVTSGGPDNASWSKWTPTGKLEMTVTNPEAAHYFKVGQSYYLYFREVPEVTSADRKQQSL